MSSSSLGANLNSFLFYHAVENSTSDGLLIATENIHAYEKDSWILTVSRLFP